MTEDDDLEEIFEFRIHHKDYIAPALGLTYPLELEWFSKNFPDLLTLVQHDISIAFEQAKTDPVVFTASHYSRSKNWNFVIKSVKQSDLNEVRQRLEKELPELLRNWFTETIEAKNYSLKHFFVSCAANKFEYGNRDEL